MESVDVSVLLIAHNSADLLPMALSHLEQQSYPAARFEIIVVDCASTDSTPEILERYSSGSPVRIRRLPVGRVHRGVAWNEALRASTGTWIVFLDVELLASPSLVENHVHAQELYGGAAVTVGRIARHPQSVSMVLPWRYKRPEIEIAIANQPLRFLDWRMNNLALPRQWGSGPRPFNENRPVDALVDVEFAWELEQQGVQGFFSDAATAYVWTPPVLDRELRHFYEEGYALNGLLAVTSSEVLKNRYNWSEGAIRFVFGRVAAPPLRKLCEVLAESTRPRRWIERRLVEQALREGYRDAAAGRPPRTKSANC